MKVLPEHYIAAAMERRSAAQLMYEQKRFVDCIYLAGVAVECVLRTFATEDDAKEFDGRHDLRKLMKAATLERFVGTQQRESIAAALLEVWTRWKNTYRYVDEERLRGEYKRLQLDRGIKGDMLKENARQALENAATIVNKGTYQWRRAAKKSKQR